ncbi:MAG: LysE family translocator [Magnetovibrio sp.]|nr:LysE family translocator [Magnetovibrio sp.]
MSPEFLITSLIVVIMPGTGVIYTLAQGLGGGTRSALAATVGCTLGIVPHMAASIFGLAALLHTSAVAFQALKIAGVAYLLYLAWGTLKDHGGLNVGAEHKRKKLHIIAWRGFLINILNPKLSLFFLAFLPQFVPTSTSNPVWQMVLLSTIFMGLTAIVFAIYGLAAANMRDQVLTRPAVMNWFRRGFAAAFGALALRLSFADR